MPLRKGSSSRTVGLNIKKLREEGYEPKQAKAITLRKAGKPKKKKD